MSVLESLADLFERAAADRTPARAVVGNDPAQFAETFVRDHSDGRWTGNAWRDEWVRAIEREINSERDRLASAIERADAKQKQAHA
jgi:DNA-binding ferritin-like protein (Dps family)